MNVKIRKSFAYRNKMVDDSESIQLHQFTTETRVALKNYCIELFDRCSKSFNLTTQEFHDYIAKLLAINVFYIPLDSYESKYECVIEKLYDVFNNGSCYEILSIMEYLANNLYARDFEAEIRYPFGDSRKTFDICDSMNELFEKESMGYRFINKIIVPIINDSEVKTISEATDTSYNRVNEHINKALQFLDNKKFNDYKNTIKEVMCAMEGLCSNYSKKETLGQMIEDISSRMTIHEDLKEAIKRLYKFACNEPGIRHESTLAGNNITFDEAKLVLVICSGIINYLIPVLESSCEDNDN